MGVYKRGDVWWYRFTWKGEALRESTKQNNHRVALQIEAAHKTSLAKGEVGIRDKAPVPTLQQFAERDFMPFIESRCRTKPKTLEYYRNGWKNLKRHSALSNCPLDAITVEMIMGFGTKQQEAGLAIASVNRQLEVLRRMLRLAMEWNKVERALPKVEMIRGENRRERVLSEDEESRYLDATTHVGENIQAAYQRALKGIRAMMRDKKPIKPEDPLLLRDVTTILADCGLRPEECFRLGGNTFARRP